MRDPMLIVRGSAGAEPYPEPWARLRDGYMPPDAMYPDIARDSGVAGAGPALSPLCLIQEMVATDWQGVLGALMHVRTRREQGHPTTWRILRRWPTPEELVRANRASLELVLKPCGLQRQRVMTLIEAAQGWCDGLRPTAPGIIDGCGEYVSASFRLFALGDLHQAPEDGELRAFVWWALARKRAGEPWLRSRTKPG